MDIYVYIISLSLSIFHFLTLFALCVHYIVICNVMQTLTLHCSAFNPPSVPIQYRQEINQAHAEPNSNRRQGIWSKIIEKQNSFFFFCFLRDFTPALLLSSLFFCCWYVTYGQPYLGIYHSPWHTPRGGLFFSRYLQSHGLSCSTAHGSQLQPTCVMAKNKVQSQRESINVLSHYFERYIHKKWFLSTQLLISWDKDFPQLKARGKDLEKCGWVQKIKMGESVMYSQNSGC